MAWFTTSAVFVITIGLAVGFNTPPFPGFHYPDGNPSLQIGSHSGGLYCVREPADCACPTTYFPRSGCHNCQCGPVTGPSRPPTFLPTTPASPVPSGPVVMTTGTSALPVTTHVTSSVTDYCDIAKTLCRKNCPDGYLVDPDDCTFCLCKKDLIAG